MCGVCMRLFVRTCMHAWHSLSCTFLFQAGQLPCQACQHSFNNSAYMKLTVNVISAMPLKNICREAKKRKPANRWALLMPSTAMWVRRKRVAHTIAVNVACKDTNNTLMRQHYKVDRTRALKTSIAL